MEDVATNSETKAVPTKLAVQAGEPLDMFSATAWAVCFTEFLYGDCAPNIERPVKISMQELFAHL